MLISQLKRLHVSCSRGNLYSVTKCTFRTYSLYSSPLWMIYSRSFVTFKILSLYLLTLLLKPGENIMNSDDCCQHQRSLWMQCECLTPEHLLFLKWCLIVTSEKPMFLDIQGKYIYSPSCVMRLLRVLARRLTSNFFFHHNSLKICFAHILILINW